MNKIYKGKASWYGAENEKLNKHVALMGSVKCHDCLGKDCTRCGGDKLLTNPMLFNSNLMEGAICERLKDDVPMGSVVRITWNCIHTIYVRITDWGIPKDHENLKDRIIDLTISAFYLLTENTNLGIVDIEMEVIE